MVVLERIKEEQDRKQMIRQVNGGWKLTENRTSQSYENLYQQLLQRLVDKRAPEHDQIEFEKIVST